MPALTHVFRRGAIYTWRRRLPSCIRVEGQSKVLQVSLRTCGQREAKSIGAVVTAESDRVFRAMQQNSLTPAAAKAFLERVVREAQAQFARLRLASLDDGGVAEWEENRRFDLAAGHAFRLLGCRGRSASLPPAERRDLAEAGLSAEDIVRVEHLIELYARDYWGESRMARLRGQLAEAPGVRDPSLLDLQLARQLALKGRAAALLQRHESEVTSSMVAEMALARRLAEEDQWGAGPEAEAAWPAAVPNEPKQREREAHTPDRPFRSSFVGPDAGISAAFNPLDRNAHLRPPEETAPVTSTSPEAEPRSDEPEPSPYSPYVLEIAERLIAVKQKDGTEAKFQTQIRMVATMLIEVTGVTDITALRQHHFALYRDALNQLPKAWGKSPKDKGKTVLEIIREAEGLPPSRKGLAAATVNRNLGILHQILAKAASEGLSISSTIGLRQLRAKKAGRARDDRPAFTLGDVRAIFQHPVWTGSRSKGRRMDPGKLIIRDGLYWAPLIASYTGARREEIAGLSVRDLARGSDGGWVFHISFTESRRLKNAASVRDVPVHSHLIELGLIDHLKERKAKGDHDLFPDLKPTNLQQSYGDALDYRWRKIKNAQLGPGSEEKVFHSFRHYVINQLKRDKLLKDAEIKDIVGHAGKDETAERYGDATPIETLRAAIERLPSAI